MIPRETGKGNRNPEIHPDSGLQDQANQYR
jgi:hypothetical protein